MADKEEIRDRSDVIDIIGSFVPLKKRGRNYLGLCPFHSEKTPSFNVDPITRSYKCFGCGASGDIFSFIEKYENMTFVEAAEFLARRAGLKLDRIGPETTPEQLSERDKIYEINKVAVHYFRERLAQVKLAHDYLYEQRGISHEIVQKFQLGYAPEGWDGLAGYLQSRKYDLKAAVAAGLIRSREDGGLYDVFRHRAIFPIHDEQERVVGFGGRAFGDDQPKYLNTGETPVFTKSKILYGLPFARKSISTKHTALLMEGYMDVIAAHQAGFTNAVATLGTSLTEEHSRKLSRLAPDNPSVILVYDADNAGIKATLRASEILEEQGVGVRVVRLENGDDPDSMLKRGDIAGFQRAIDTAQGRMEYLIDYAKTRHNLVTEEGRQAFLQNVYRILINVESYGECDRHLEKIAVYHPMNKFSRPIAVAEMQKELNEFRQRRRLEVKKKAQHIVPSPGSPETSAKASSNNIPANNNPAPAQGNYDRDFPPNRFIRDWDKLTPAQRMKVSKRSIAPEMTPQVLVTREERAEREIMFAMVDPAWRPKVVELLNFEYLQSRLAQDLFAYVIDYNDELGETERSFISCLQRNAKPVTCEAVIQLMQEFHARLTNVPITESAILQCMEVLRRAYVARLRDSNAQPLLKDEFAVTDHDQIKKHLTLSQELQGSTELI